MTFYQISANFHVNKIENMSFTISLYVICSLAKTGHICKKLFKSAIFSDFFQSYLLIINVKTDRLPVLVAGRFSFFTCSVDKKTKKMLPSQASRRMAASSQIYFSRVFPFAL